MYRHIENIMPTPASFTCEPGTQTDICTYTLKTLCLCLPASPGTQTDICTDTLKTLCLRLPASPGTNKYKNDRTHATYKQGCESISYALQCRILLRRENPTCSYWVPVAAAIRGFNMALFTTSRGNNFVRCTCASPSALLVTSLLMCSIFFT